jgi:DNA polymerase-1
MKRAMIEVDQVIAPMPDVRMILTVHDELLFEVPAAAAEETAALVKAQMQSAADLKVPLVVDVGVGRTWREAKH